MIDIIDYGPLQKLIGTWTGDKGLDIAPEPGGTEKNPYYETIVFTACEDVENAESELLTFLHYRQIVQRKSNNKIFHDQTGYWMWNSNTKTVMHSFTIPRGVAILAGGLVNEKLSENSEVTLEVNAKVNDKNWGIIQSPFMQKNAKTIAFSQKLHIRNNQLSYTQTTSLEIYGRSFEHTDNNSLIKE
ncbi:MAG: hypothetical protein COB02_14035 [Candidatus Cloacimonadota bacterium]|nr:MAG: hypothetical protein COB02_14035 [Candidatus Cloacimonadota bacterium]